MLQNSTSWLLLVNLELAFGYSAATKFKLTSLNTMKSSALLILFGMATLLCIVTQFIGVFVVLLAGLSILSQMMHSKNFEPKNHQNYAQKSTIRDAKSVLVFYRCAISLLLWLFSYVIVQIFNNDYGTVSKSVPSLTKKFLAFAVIGL